MSLMKPGWLQKSSRPCKQTKLSGPCKHPAGHAPKQQNVKQALQNNKMSSRPCKTKEGLCLGYVMCWQNLLCFEQLTSQIRSFGATFQAACSSCPVCSCVPCSTTMVQASDDQPQIHRNDNRNKQEQKKALSLTHWLLRNTIIQITLHVYRTHQRSQQTVTAKLL